MTTFIGKRDEGATHSPWLIWSLRGAHECKPLSCHVISGAVASATPFPTRDSHQLLRAACCSLGIS